MARLTSDIKEEINHVKTRIEKISANEDNDITVETTEEDPIFSANLGKGDDGISVSEDDALLEKNKEEGSEEVITPVDIEEELVEVSSSSEESLDVEDEGLATSSEESLEVLNHDELLSEVKELIEMDNFDETIEKLDEIADNFSDEDGEVKGEFEELEEGSDESATSTIE